jgi:hypothetical protein
MLGECHNFVGRKTYLIIIYYVGQIIYQLGTTQKNTNFSWVCLNNIFLKKISHFTRFKRSKFLLSVYLVNYLDLSTLLMDGRTAIKKTHMLKEIN